MLRMNQVNDSTFFPVATRPKGKIAVASVIKKAPLVNPVGA
ncbi:hypothetical protein ACUY4Q_002020 [Phytobacter sp. AG2a]